MQFRKMPVNHIPIKKSFAFIAITPQKNKAFGMQYLMVCVVAVLIAATAFGQSTVETINNRGLKKSESVKTGPSMENMKPIDMISPGDTMIKNTQTGYWTCLIHPDIHQSESGNCPVCGKKLVFKKSDKYTTRISSVDDGNMK